MISLLKRRAFLIVLGFLLLALFIWYAGPLFTFADYRPLESVTARLIAMALVVALWAASVLLKRFRANRASDHLVAAVVRQSDTGRMSAEVLQLRERFEDAANRLKQKRRGGHSLYDLPWYVIIGAPGSGKTTALLNSGLNFPLEQRVGKGALRGVGGTRNCDWWFTDEAVLLDTAGRYTTQDSDADADSAAWAEFLALLRKYRQRRPVNGVILTISAQDLMMQGQGGREAHVVAARRRLSELNQGLRIQLPVYLMVTKCDLVAGFTEYFDDLAQEGRAQVWGVTFPYEQTLNGEAAQAFPAEFDAVIARLNARLFARLDECHDARRRTKVFAFPQQMATLRDALADFTSEVFASTRFEQQILLRGIYFTSGTQEGTPIDRLLGAIGRRFAVAPEAVISPGARGKAYFIERLLKEVLLAESGLAGVNRRLEVRQAAIQLGAYAAMALIAVLGIVAFTVSYGRNHAYAGQVAADVANLRKVSPGGATASLETLLPRFNALRAVVDSANRYQEDTPRAMRWGLYQGASVGNAARDAYARELNNALWPRVAARFKQRLIDYSAEPEKLYEYLKAYLMLGQPEHLDKAQLGFLADLEWKTAYAAAPDTGAALSKHFRTLLESEDTLHPVALDQSLVARARSTIRQASIPRLMYNQLKLTYAGDAAHALHLDVAAGLGSEQVFRRKSGASLSEPMRSLYTREVFAQVTGRSTDEIVKQFAADYWVWGDARVSVTGSAKLAADVTDVYEKDYIAAWEAVLSDIQLVSFPTLTLAKTADALAILAQATTSPLRGLLQTVDTNTFLVKPPDAAQPGGTRSSAEKAVRDRLGQLLSAGKEAAGISAVPPGTQVTAHFDPIHRLVAAAPGGTLDRIFAQIGQIKEKLISVGTAPGDTSPLKALSDPGTRALLKTLQQDAAPLPPVVRGLVDEIGKGTGTVVVRQGGNELENRYRDEVLRECREVVADRYPFTATSAIDVPLADFGRLLGYNGVYETFFKTNLEPLVDATSSPWKWRAGVSGASLPPAILRQFEVAKQIRETFFRSGAQVPELSFTVTPADLDAASSRFTIEIDGQSFNYQHGPERAWPAKWPGPNPGVAAVRFEDRSGGRPNLVFEGPWAWLRLAEAGQMQRETDVRYMLSFQLGGHQARAAVEAATVRNPYLKRYLQQFRCE